jgi:hypothetical protein
VTIAPTLKEPKGWRAAARRLLARLRIGRRATEAAEFDAAERRAYEAAVKLWGSLAPATASTPRPADPPGPVPDPAAATDAPTWAALPSPQNPPDDRPTGPAGTPSEPTVAAPYRRQPGDTTAPGSLLRTPSNVTLVADEFFDSLIRRAEGDR